MDSAGTESGDRERLGDYYLYPLPARTTIANAQQKHVRFLDVKGAPATSTYEYVNRWLGSSPDPVSAASVLRGSAAHTCELPSLLRLPFAAFCLTKQKTQPP